MRGVPHASQNFACGRFSCWHRGQCISSVSRFRIVSGQPGTRHGTRAAAGARLPGRPVGHGRPDPTPTRPRAPDGRFRAWFALEPVGEPHRRLRRVRTHVYAMLLTATRHPGVLTQPAGGPMGTGWHTRGVPACGPWRRERRDCPQATSPRFQGARRKSTLPTAKIFGGGGRGSLPPGVRGRGARARGARVPPLPRRSAARPAPAGAEPGRGVTGLAAAPGDGCPSPKPRPATRGFEFGSAAWQHGEGGLCAAGKRRAMPAALPA